MPAVHRERDTRECGAITISSATRTYIENELVALEGDEDNHSGQLSPKQKGEIISTGFTRVYVEGKKIAVVGDDAKADLLHAPPLTKPKTGASKTFVG